MLSAITPTNMPGVCRYRRPLRFKVGTPISTPGWLLTRVKYSASAARKKLKGLTPCRVAWAAHRS